MNLGGLSADKAPPADAPLVLFYLMPAFMAFAGLVLAWQGDQIMLSRWTPAALATTHLLVLGSLAPVMCGALLQISPVLLGAPYRRPRRVARFTATGLGIGSLLLGAGFLLLKPTLLMAGGIMAAVGLGVFLVATFEALTTTAIRHETLWSIRLAAGALAVTIILGLVLVLARAGWIDLPKHLNWVDTHAAWGLAGWLGLLLAAVGMELIPLFYISPPFPIWLKYSFSISIILSLSLILALGTHLPITTQILFAAILLAYLLYSAYALHSEHRRQRPRRDASLWLWQASHVTVFLAFFGWLFDTSISLIGGLLLTGTLAFVIGSLLKIVPFLCWLDLQQRRIRSQHLDVKLPRLSALLPTWQAIAIAVTMILAIAALSGAAIEASLIHLAGGLLVMCAVSLAIALATAAGARQAYARLLAASNSPSD